LTSRPPLASGGTPEVKSRDHGKAGQPLGLRWTPGKGLVDLDPIGGRYGDGATRDAITLGPTLRHWLADAVILVRDR
jgi:hypothetical protein